MSDFTPGPYVATRRNVPPGFIRIDQAGGGSSIGEVFPLKAGQRVTQANAALWVAAPDLYSAARGAVQFVTDFFMLADPDECRHCRDAGEEAPCSAHMLLADLEAALAKADVPLLMSEMRP